MSEYISVQSLALSGNSLTDIIKNNALTGILSKFNSAEFETLEIVLDQDQFQAILCSLEETRNGKIVSFQDAFSDLD